MSGPLTLRMPAQPPKLVCLDLNHWIALARVLSGDGIPDGNQAVSFTLHGLFSHVPQTERGRVQRRRGKKDKR